MSDSVYDMTETERESERDSERQKKRDRGATKRESVVVRQRNG